MTQEQYEEVVRIHERLSELEDVRREMMYEPSTCLWYAKKVDGEPVYSDCTLYIADILNRYDKMIREEIDSEIKKLRKEIGQL